MTEQHPLTDKKCETLSRQPFLDPETDVKGTIYDMRAAADWQLERVLHWFESGLERGYYLLPKGFGGNKTDVDDVIYDLKEAMRPQQQENNS